MYENKEFLRSKLYYDALQQQQTHNLQQCMHGEQTNDGQTTPKAETGLTPPSTGATKQHNTNKQQRNRNATNNKQQTTNNKHNNNNNIYIHTDNN
jgi:hypothetical protein